MEKEKVLQVELDATPIKEERYWAALKGPWHGDYNYITQYVDGVYECDGKYDLETPRAGTPGRKVHFTLKEIKEMEKMLNVKIKKIKTNEPIEIIYKHGLTPAPKKQDRSHLEDKDLYFIDLIGDKWLYTPIIKSVPYKERATYQNVSIVEQHEEIISFTLEEVEEIEKELGVKLKRTPVIK